jgi:hypothetical protein
MESVPSPENVLADLGEKSVRAFGLSVHRSRVDLTLYRQTFPLFFAQSSPRGLANWINDRLWAHLGGFADEIPDMTLNEKGATREVTVGITYRFRFKRHSSTAMIASYSTLAYLDFVMQPTGQLPTMEAVRLVAGYEWLPETHEIGDAVISLRNGKDNVIWNHTLPVFDDDYGQAGGTAEVVKPQQPGPVPPTVELPDTIGRPEEKSEDK